MFALGRRTTRPVVLVALPPPPLPFASSADTLISMAARASATDDVGEHWMRSISCCGLVAIASCRQLPSIRRRCRPSRVAVARLPDGGGAHSERSVVAHDDEAVGFGFGWWRIYVGCGGFLLCWWVLCCGLGKKDTSVHIYY